VQCGSVSDNRRLSTGREPCGKQSYGSRPARDQNVMENTSGTATGRHVTQSPRPRPILNDQLGLDRGQIGASAQPLRFRFSVAFLLHLEVLRRIPKSLLRIRKTKPTSPATV
jgi:hypothetical protein